MREFIKFFIIFFVIVIVLQMIWTMNNSYLILSIILSSVLFIIIFKLSKKLKLTNIKALYISSFIVIILILFFNVFKILDVINILNKEQEILTNLEKNISNVNTTKKLKILLEENFEKDIIEEIEIPKTCFIDNNTYKREHIIALSLFKSCINYINENPRADFDYVKQNYDKYYNFLKSLHDDFGKNILIIFIICTTIEIAYIIIIVKNIKSSNITK